MRIYHSLQSFRDLALVLLTSASLAACSSNPAVPDGGDGGVTDGGDGGDSGIDSGIPTDGGPDGGDAGVDAGPDAGNQPDGGDAGVDAGPDAGGLYCPTGYTQTPYLTDTATTHTFPGAMQVRDSQKDYMAVLETDQGRIVMHLLSQTPITSNSFIFLTLNHFFDGIAFHRVIEGFVAQGGDPNTLSSDMMNWGLGGPGYTFGLEVVASLNYDGPGVVGMARANDPNTNGSQFFITFAAQPSLNQMYTIFAEVTEGMDVLPNIVRGMPPVNPTRMTEVHICEQ